MKLNLTGVEAASVKETPEYKSVKKGLQPLKIIEVTSTVSASGKEGIEVTFEAEDTATFRHKFWATASALPRIVYLIEKFTDNPVPTGDLGIEVLSALLVGKTKPVVVDVELADSKDGKYTNEYPTLRFAGFVNPTGKSAEPIIKDNRSSSVNPIGNLPLDLLIPSETSDLPW